MVRKQVRNKSEKKDREKKSVSDPDKTFLPQMYLLLQLLKKLIYKIFTFVFYEQERINLPRKTLLPLRHDEGSINLEKKKQEMNG